jgi:carotenoid cleavage dioxygenase-like enzyme
MAPSTELTITNLKVVGTLPAGLSGQLLSIGPNPETSISGTEPTGLFDCLVHGVELHAGRAVSYRSRSVVADVVDAVNVVNVVAFGGSILVLGNNMLAYELPPDLNILRRVDLAGQLRGITPYPKRDPITGDLHVLTVGATGSQAYVVVSSRAHTRTSRHLVEAPAPIRDLAITRDCIVFAAEGYVGIATRCTDARVTWVAAELNAPYLVSAHDVGDTVVVYAVTPALERWTVHASSVTLHREVLDPTPRRPSDLVFVADTSRRSDPDGGWLVGFVHDRDDGTDLVVLDAADIDSPASPAIATIAIPRYVPPGLHSTWISSTQP